MEVGGVSEEILVLKGLKDIESLSSLTYLVRFGIRFVLKITQ